MAGVSKRTLIIAVVVLVMTTPGIVIQAGGLPITPPKEVWATPCPDGRSLNISWNPNGTNAWGFAIYHILESGEPMPLSEISANRTWFLHDGLEPWKTYKYVVKSLDERGVLVGAPSPMAVGWPLPEPNETSPRDPPVLHPFDGHTNKRSIILSGVALMPGTTIEVERIHMETWSTYNVTVRSSPITGWFSVVTDLELGENLIHARVSDCEFGTGLWTIAAYVVLDIEPPTFNIQCVEGSHEVGSQILMNVECSSHMTDVDTIEWSCVSNGSLKEEDTGASFVYTPQEEGVHVVTVTVTDLAGNVATKNRTVHVTLRDAPPILTMPSRIELKDLKPLELDLDQWVMDPDDEFGTLNWTLNVSNTELFSIMVNGYCISLHPGKKRSGEGILQVRVEDPSGKYDEGSVIVSVRSSSTTEAFWTSGWTVGIALAIVMGLLTAVVGRRWYGRDEYVGKDEPAPFFVKSIYLIHKDGRMIKDVHADDYRFMDPDMVSSMFTAIQDFISDSFNTSAPLHNLVFGDDNLTVTRGKNIYLATISYRSVDRDYLDKARCVVNRIEAEYRGVIDDWDGTYSKLQGVESILQDLHKSCDGQSLDEVIEICRPASVYAKPALDFHHGLVVYSVELVNSTDEIIIDPYLDIIWDDNVLHLDGCEPEGSRMEGKFRLENIDPGEQAGLKLYFDPQMCLESFIKGSLVYMDVRGRLHTEVLENTLVDINCPIFFTVENANTAMVNRLLEEELHCTDSKVFRYAVVLDSRSIYKKAIETAASYNVKMLMELEDEDPFCGEAWFYGETKIKEAKVLIRVSVKEEDNTVEFLAAANMDMVLTGMIAELGHIFLKKMDDNYTKGYMPDRVVRKYLKDDFRGLDISDRDGIVKQLFENAMMKKDVHLVTEMPPRDD